MATNNSSDQDYTNNSDGFTLKGGTTKRALIATGADITLTGSGTNVYTFPSATDTLVGRGSTDTLTNKTLTSPTVNNPTFTGHGKIAAITASSAAINTTDTIIVSGTIPTPVVGTTYRIVLAGTCTSSVANANTWTIRAGTAGTTADAAIATVNNNAATTGTNQPFRVEFLFNCRTTGTTGTVGGNAFIMPQAATGIGTVAVLSPVIVATSTFNTTTATKLSLSYATAASSTTTTFTTATLEIL